MTTPVPDKPPNTGGEEDGAMYKEVMEFQAKLRAQPGDRERYGAVYQEDQEVSTAERTAPIFQKK